MNTPAESTVPALKASNYRPIGKGSLVGVFSLEMPSGLILHGCCLFRKEDRAAWVAGPSKQIKAGDKVRYEPMVEFASREASARFTAGALSALDTLGVAR